jgi:hypothetical protein
MWELWGRKSTVRQVSEIRGESQSGLACGTEIFLPATGRRWTALAF